MIPIEDKKNFYKNSIYFISVAIAIFTISFLFLYFLGLVPNSFKGPQEINENFDLDYWVGDYDIVEENILVGDTKPDRIVIDKIGVDTVVGQPQSRSVSVLDQFLTKGAVYYPGSGTIETGNMFIFGHSTGIRVVQNQAYKTFNGLNKLLSGDIITVEADGSTYEYVVTKVKLLNEDDALITFDNTKRTLTLSTCNTFGAKQERWIVESEFLREV
jgi:LPXTG-site transpeptidase (sortase) family protein